MSDNVVQVTVKKKDSIKMQDDQEITVSVLCSSKWSEVKRIATSKFFIPPHKSLMFAKKNELDAIKLESTNTIQSYLDDHQPSSGEIVVELYYVLGDLSQFNPKDFKRTDTIVFTPKLDPPPPEKPMKMDEFFEIPTWFDPNRPPIKRRDLPELKKLIPEGKVCFLLDNTLSQEECRHLIEKTEGVGYRSTSDEFSEQYRTTDRILIKNEELAKEIFRRIVPFLQQDPEIRVALPFGFAVEGRWIPMGLNECFRFCRYVKGGHFSPHVDTNFQRNAQERSILTCMIYLNEEFAGGTTNFLDEKVYKEESKKLVLEKIVPKSGTAIIFTHNIFHEGTALESGTKYIMRTDIIFSRVEDWSADTWRDSPDFRLMWKYYQLAGLLEQDGKVEDANLLYEKAQDIQLRQIPDLSRRTPKITTDE